jgi:hypothetical protein
MHNTLWLSTRAGILRHKSGLIFLLDKTSSVDGIKVDLMSAAIYKAKAQAKGHTESEIKDFIDSRTIEAQELSQEQNQHREGRTPRGTPKVFNA